MSHLNMMMRKRESCDAECLRAFRTQLGLTTLELAAAIGLDVQLIESFERDGIPRWAAYALVGFAIDQHSLSPEEAARLVGMSSCRE